MNLPMFTYHDIPRLLTLLASVAGIFYLLSTAIKFRKFIPIRFYVPLLLWLAHEALFYVVYYVSSRFTALLHIEPVRIWPQLLHFHGIITAIGGVVVFRVGIKWVQRYL